MQRTNMTGFPGLGLDNLSRGSADAYLTSSGSGFSRADRLGFRAPWKPENLGKIRGHPSKSRNPDWTVEEHMYRTCVVTLTVLTCVVSGSFANGPQDPLRVSLFPWVPSPKGIENVVRQHWEGKHPNVPLEFVQWDGGYDDDPADGVDVFEIDALMLNYFVANSFAAELSLSEVAEVDDFYDFALRGSMVGGKLYGIPRISCTPMLMYRSGDDGVAAAKGLQGLFDVLGSNDLGQAWPPKGKGLLIDLTGGTTCAGFYLDAVADAMGTFSITQPLPAADQLDNDAITRLRLLTKMAGPKQATCESCWGQRAPKFAEGCGRALVGWSERLSKMPVDYHSNVKVRPLPLDEKNSINLLYVDTLLVNSTLTGERRKLAIEFANLVASSVVVREAFLVRDEKTKSPQYLLPVRKSVMNDPRLLREAPLYSQLRVAVEKHPRTFRLGADARFWLERVKGTIRTAITK